MSSARQTSTALVGKHRSIVKREDGVLVEVLHEPAIEPWICAEFFGVHAVTDDFGIGDILRKMAHPAGHQVEHSSALGDP